MDSQTFTFISKVTTASKTKMRRLVVDAEEIETVGKDDFCHCCVTKTERVQMFLGSLVRAKKIIGETSSRGSVTARIQAKSGKWFAP